MLDFKLPQINEDERQEIWENLKKGDKLACIGRNKWNSEYFVNYYVITNKTAKGSVRLDSGELLKEFPSNYYIINDELLKCEEMIKLEKDVSELIYKANRYLSELKNNLTSDDAIVLKEILERTIGNK